MSEAISYNRRRFLGTAAMTLAAAGATTQLSLLGSGQAQASTLNPSAGPTSTRGTHTSFASLKQVEAGDLTIGYAEAGPPTGPAVILLHGWPYDIHSYVDVAPLLAAKGYRVIVPYLRGYGSTRFLASDTFRNAQQAAVALDIIALMDALKIQQAILGGFDWGSRTVAVMAALWPARVRALVAVSGYLITNLQGNLLPLPPQAELGWWYRYYFALQRGELGYSQYTHDFNKLIWSIVSPKWDFDAATYDRTAAAFTNPDHVAIVIHNYRWQLSLAPGDPRYDALEARLATRPVITVPTITIASDFDGAAADGAAYRKLFSGEYAHRILAGIGHNVPQEAPEAFAQAVVDVDHF
jgi:pimeloyl-ACP methyl ester carboxylesterase